MVSTQIIVIAWPPTFFSETNAVFIPIAAIAVTRHQLDIFRRYSFKNSGKSDIEPIGISTIKPIAKNGIGSFDLTGEIPFCRKRKVRANIIGTNNVTLTILTTAAVSPAVSEMLYPAPIT